MLTVFVRTNWKYQATIYKTLLTIEKKEIQKNRGWIPGEYADPSPLGTPFVFTLHKKRDDKSRMRKGR
jgi:hypothetical protein